MIDQHSTAHYLGLRVGYDLNVMKPYDTKGVGVSTSGYDLYMDNLNFALTYRYAFGR